MPQMPYTLIRAFAVLALVLSASAQQNKGPVDYVNPNIGGIGQLLSATSPNVIMPYGTMRISPDQFEGFSGAPEPFRGGGSKYFFQAQFPDMTGLIGQYAQGTEPSFHIPYLSYYAGAPWVT